MQIRPLKTGAHTKRQKQMHRKLLLKRWGITIFLPILITDNLLVRLTMRADHLVSGIASDLSISGRDAVKSRSAHAEVAAPKSRSLFVFHQTGQSHRFSRVDRLRRRTVFDLLLLTRHAWERSWEKGEKVMKENWFILPDGDNICYSYGSKILHSVLV